MLENNLCPGSKTANSFMLQNHFFFNIIKGLSLPDMKATGKPRTLVKECPPPGLNRSCSESASYYNDAVGLMSKP